MKLPTPLLPLILAATTLHAGEFIRQHQLASGLVWDRHVQSPEGTAWSPVPVGKGGSLFTLYALGTGSDTKLYRLDATAVGEPFPAVEVGIVSEDPHLPPRTRADRAFFVTVKPQGGGRAAPLALEHSGTSYDPATRAAGAQPRTSHFGWTLLSGKKPRHARYFSQLPCTDPTRAEGEETVTVYSRHPDSKQWLPLGTAAIQIWPVAQAAIRGIAPGATITDATAKNRIDLVCRDLYPDSVTYAQIYRGKEKLGTMGKTVPGSVVRFDTQVPQNQKIPLGGFLGTLEDGHYTLEVLTITPFNNRRPERLCHVSFVIDRGLHNPGLVSNGSAGTRR